MAAFFLPQPARFPKIMSILFSLKHHREVVEQIFSTSFLYHFFGFIVEGTHRSLLAGFSSPGV